jgi:hypothetical protein
MSDVRSPEDWGDAYAELESTYAAFVERLEELLRNLLSDEDLGYVESVWSTMKVESLVSAIYARGRAGTPIDDPFVAFGDLGAVTILTRTKTESEAICALVEREFDVDADGSLSFGDAESSNGDLAGGGVPGRVFYDYPRLVVSLSEERRELPEWSRFAGLRAEIRVPTLLQRAWQDIDEKILPYSRDDPYPDGVQDIVLRAVRLISEADDELARIAETTAEIEGEYARALERGELDGRLDLSALYVYVRDSDTVSALVSTAESAGMRHDADPPYVTEVNLWLLRHCGFRSVRQLDAFLRESSGRARDVYERLVELVRAEDDFVPWATREAVLEWLLLVLMRADADAVALTRYRASIETAINTLIGNRVER